MMKSPRAPEAAVSFGGLQPRPMIPAPAEFDGDLADLYGTAIEPNLPAPSEVEYWHYRLLEHCRQKDPVFIVRHVGGIERGTIYNTTSQQRVKPSDNSPAWWMHFVAFNGIRDVDFEQMPTHMFEVSKWLPTSINKARWHVAHILNAKDWNTDWKNWSRDELVRRFIRNVHPCNCFYVPKREWHRYGGDPGVIGFFASIYAQRYAAVWQEFLEMAGGVEPQAASVPRYVYSAKEKTPVQSHGIITAQNVGVGGGLAKASYAFSRLCFRADIIEPLSMEDIFEVVTPDGIFRMTKAQFYEDFSNVVESRSYREGGIYHSPSPPKKALKYLIVDA